MQKLTRDDQVLLCLQVFFTAIMLSTAIIALWQAEYFGMLVYSCVAAMSAIITLIDIDRWTEHGKYNGEFFSQHVF